MQLRNSWEQLLQQSSSNNFFLSWDWLWNWWQVYSNHNDKLAIFLLQKEDDIIGIAPFYIREKRIKGVFPVRNLMFLGTQEEDEGDVGSDYMDIICNKGEEAFFINKIFHHIAHFDLCDAILLSKIDKDSSTVSLLQREAKQYSFSYRNYGECLSPYIVLPKSWDIYLSTLTSSLRYKIRSERRKLEKLQSVNFKMAESDTDIEYYFAELVRLHQARWESRGHCGSFSNKNFLNFHQRLAPLLVKKGFLQLILLSENMKSRAVIYNFYYNNKIYFYQSGVDATVGVPAFGYLLHSYCIEYAIKNGYREYDFLPKGKTDEYKDRFANAHRRITNIFIARNKFIKYYDLALESMRHIYHHIKVKKI